MQHIQIDNTPTTWQPNAIYFVRNTGQIWQTDSNGVAVLMSISSVGYNELKQEFKEIVSNELITSIYRGYIDNNGIYHASSNWRTSNYIDVNEGDVITYSGNIVNTAADNLVGYDTDGNYVATLLSSGNYYEKEIIIPSGIKKIRGCATYDCLFLSIKKQEEFVTLKKINTGKVWVSIGDSITELGGYQITVLNNFLFKNYVNEGYSGAPLTTGITDHPSIIDYTENILESNIYTIFAGTNDFKLNAPLGSFDDYINNSGSGNFFGALRVIIDRLYSKNSKAIILLFTNLRRDNDGYSSNSVNTAGLKLDDYNEAIRVVAKYEGFPVLDLFNYSGISDRNLGDYTIDGLHPNDDGMKLIGSVITDFFKKYI